MLFTRESGAKKRRWAAAWTTCAIVAVAVAFWGWRDHSRAASGLWVDAPEFLSSAAALAYYDGIGWQATTAAPDPEIVLFAETLGNDPERIEAWVRNNAELEWRFGLSKGGRGVLLDKSGTPLDQAHLLVEALRASGVNAQYVLGTATLTRTEFQQWTGISSPSGARDLLARGGFSGVVSESGGAIAQVQLLHVWVKATIAGQERVLDPSFKTNVLSQGDDVRGAMGFQGSAMVSTLNAGMTQQDNSGVIRLRNANVSGLDSTLSGYARTLQAWVESNRADADIFDLVGGRKLVRGAEGLAAPTYAVAAVRTFAAGELPNALRTTVTIKGPDSVVRPFFADEIYGRELMYRHGRPQLNQYETTLYVDGVAQGPRLSLFGAGQVQRVALEIDHPYAAAAGTYMDEVVAQDVGLYDHAPIILGLGRGGSEASERIGGRFGRDETYSLPTSGGEASRFTTGGRSAISMGYGWLAQFDRLTRITGAVAGATAEHHHTIGMVSTIMPHDPLLTSRAQSIRINLASQVSVAGHSGPSDRTRAASLAISSGGSALEGSVAEQVNDTPYPASTTSKIAWSQGALNTDVEKRWIYLVTPSNWAATRPSFPADHADSPTNSITALGLDQHIAAGGFAVAPVSSFLGPGSNSAWRPEHTAAPADIEVPPLRGLERGGAFIGASADNRRIIHAVVRHWPGGPQVDLGGGGGGAPDPLSTSDPSADAANEQRGRSAAGGSNVDVRSGGLTFAPSADLTVGQGDGPLSISFQREFRSGSGGRFPAVKDADWLNRDGWSHNHHRRASLSSNGLNAMGARTAREGVGAVVAAVASIHFYEEAGATPNAVLLARWVGASLVQDWLAKSIVVNTVTLTTGHSSEAYVRLSSGAFAPPPGGANSLVQTGSRVLTPSTAASKPQTWNAENVSFTLTRSDRSVESYVFAKVRPYPLEDWEAEYPDKPEHRISTVVYPQGVTTTYQYDTLGRISSVANNIGVGLNFTYSAFDGDVQVRGSASTRGIRLRWDADQLGQTTWAVRSWDALGQQTVYQMAERRTPVNSGARLERVTLPSGTHAATLGYDSAGRVQTVTDALNRVTRYYSSAGGRFGRVKDALNNEWRTYYDEDGNVITSVDPMQRTTTNAYDGYGRLVARTSAWGDETTFKYDERSNLIEKAQTPKAGCGSDVWWCQTITVKSEYHPTWNKPTKIIQPATIGGLAQSEWTFTYNAQGLVQEVRSPTVFDSRNNQNAQAVTRTWYDNFGRVTKTQDPTGIESTQVWGGGGLPAFCLRQSIASSQPGGLNLTTAYVCDVAGDVTSVTDPRGNTTTTTYDALRRKTEEVGPDSTKIRTRWVYDLDGNVVEEIRRDASALVWRTTATTYSLTGKPLTVTDPSGDVSRTCYDALDRAVVAVDPTGRATRTSYNAASQPTLVERWFTANVGDATCALTNARPAGITTNTWRKYEYNAAGLQSAEIDANGNRTQMTYDGLGRLIMTTFADGAEAWSISDQRGQAVISKTRGGDYADAYFDQLGRIHHVWEHGASDVYLKGRNTRTGYDLAGRPVWKDVSTQPTATWNESLRRDVHIYGYDAAGRATTDQVQPMDAAIGTAAKTLTYGYDAAGNRTSIKWPDGFEATYVFDAVNRPQTVTFGGHTATITHNSLGLRTGVSRSSGSSSTYTYEPDNDLLSLTHNWKASSGQTAGGWTYVHDAAGRLTETSVSRLDLEWLPTTAYAKAYGPANNLNQVASQAGQALTFNANGNLATFQGATYTWALGNRLVGVSRPGMTASYVYDGEDRRTMKVVDGVTTRTLWSGADEVAEMDGAGNILRRFIPDGSGAMDGRLASLEANGTIYWHHTDHQGSVIATSNASGAPVSLVNYSPNGELGTSLDGTALTAPPTGSPFGYTGRQYDPETGLWQYRARYYHPQLGQFLSHDPIGTKDDPNLYMYVANDPVNNTDPTGMIICCEVTLEGYPLDNAAGAFFGHSFVRVADGDTGRAYIFTGAPSAFFPGQIASSQAAGANVSAKDVVLQHEFLPASESRETAYMNDNGVTSRVLQSATVEMSINQVVSAGAAISSTLNSASIPYVVTKTDSNYSSAVAFTIFSGQDVNQNSRYPGFESAPSAERLCDGVGGAVC